MQQRKILVDVGFYSEFPKKLPELQDIVSEGAVGFKLFMGSQVGGLNIDDDQALQEAFVEVAKLKAPVAVHAEDRALLMANEEKLKQAKKAASRLSEGTHGRSRIESDPAAPKTKRENRFANAFLPRLNNGKA